MRIALTIEHFNPGVGGAEGFAAMLTRKLSRKGHDVHVLAPHVSSVDGSVEVHQVDFSGMPSMLEGIEPDITVDWGLNMPADLHRLGGGVHEEFLRFNAAATTPVLRPFKRLSQRLSRKHNRIIKHERSLLVRSSDQLLAVSEFVAAQVRRVVADVGDRLHVLRNGVDTDRFTPVGEIERQKQRDALGIPQDAFVCLFVGHNLRLKNLALLQRTFPEIHRQNPKVRLVVFGKRRPSLAAPWLLHVAASDRPEDVYSAADVLLHPTFYDACANVVLEAMACALPVVTSDLNGSAEFIVEGVNGHVLPVVGGPGVDERWKSCILELSNSQCTGTDMARAARQYAQQNNIDKYVNQFESLLESIET
jgi:UDP-glucose:(heptosyl)LPS alpha-1,3-glucosyltransferase